MELGEIFEIVSYFTGAKNALVKFDFEFFLVVLLKMFFAEILAMSFSVLQ